MDNHDLTDLQRLVLSRRRFIGTGALAGAALFLAGSPLGRTALANAISARPLLGFDNIAASTADTITLPPGYRFDVLISWGQPLHQDSAAYRGDGSNSAEEQLGQFGENNDGMSFFPWPGDANRALMAINNEYCNYPYLLAHGKPPQSLADVRKAQAAVGVTVIEVKRDADGAWQFVQGSAYNRRIHANLPMEISGPARGHASMKTAADPAGIEVLGTFQNCANGMTPWGTYLTCEENFNNYFGTTTGSDQRNDAQKRYGLSGTTTGYGWEQVVERFDYVKEPNESNRFGWIVEIDPFAPNATPRKRTALGRFKHENAAYALTADKRIVVYSGDDQANDYMYKFVSDRAYVEGGDNSALLDSGRLYVAKFKDGAASGDFMGDGEWLLLDKTANPVLAADSRFANQAEVLINARLAADAVGATPMDRPEWVTVHPTTGEVYVTLTNNSGRSTTDDANPRPSNRYGQIVRWREAGGNPAATTFEWDIFVLAGNPIKYTDRADLKSGSANVTVDNTFNSPDGLGFDPDGRLWIQTDGNYSNAGEYEGQGNNQMLCADPASKEIRRFFVGPKECEVTGLTFTPDRRTLFINIQHPGEGGDSHWPEGGNALPRSATVVITKNDGGVIGS